MIAPRAYAHAPSPAPARVRPAPTRLPREVMRLLPRKLLTELRDRKAARLAGLKAELGEAQRAATAEPPTPEDQAPRERENPPSRVLLGS